TPAAPKSATGSAWRARWSTWSCGASSTSLPTARRQAPAPACASPTGAEVDERSLDLRGWTHDRRGHVGRPSRKDKPVLPDYCEGIQIKTEDEDPRFNNAVARGLAILRTFQFDRKLLGNVEIAAATNLPKPTVSRLTYTLTQL